MPLAAGMKLDGYEILNLLGAGGMGEVYRARDPVLKRDVAIKIMSSLDSGDLSRLRRFEHEAQAVAALNHPNILAIYQLGVFEGAPYLVSELLEGSTLRQLLQPGPLPVRKMIDFGVQIAHGLAAAHEKCIVHRDLKPENLFVTKDGRVKILDFGLAKLTQRPADSREAEATVTHETDAGMVMGTVGYMAPEQVRGQPVDHRADIFAFGAILYEMLAGVRAFKKPSAAETMTAILNEDPPPISQISIAAPPGLLRVVHRCLEKNPEQRFQSASDLAFALEALSETGTASGASIRVPVSPQTKKWLIWATGLAAAVALVAVVYFALSRPPKQLQIPGYTQVTHDGSEKSLAGVGRNNLYITQDEPRSIAQVTIASGDTVPIPVPVQDPYLLDVSPDGSTFLIASDLRGQSKDHPLWSIRTGFRQRMGYAVDAAWSPDGKLVAFSTLQGDIDIVASDGSGTRKLASVGGKVYQISWAPDGKIIRFTRDNLLWEMASNGSNLHQLLPNWHAPSIQCCGNWSIDGKFYFFVSGSESQIWALDERRSLFRKPPTEPMQLTSGPIRWSRPIPGKDGSTLFARGIYFRAELSRFDSSTGKFRPFLGGKSAEFVSFSKDGKYVAYVSFPDGILWRANRDGSNPIQLTDPPMYAVLPRWSPDGSQILFMNVPALGAADSYIVSSEGNSPQKLLPSDNGPNLDPGWSPDGQRIVFCVGEPGGADPKSLIRILDVASRQITTLPESLGMSAPRWSPDGRSISAVADASNTLKIFDLQSNRWSSQPLNAAISYPEWSRDSQFVYFLRKTPDPGVYRIRAKGGPLERVVDLTDWSFAGWYKGSMTLDPTDAPLMLRGFDSDDMYSLPVELK